jgi:predicted nucleotidyltransferase component of viral defense system
MDFYTDKQQREVFHFLFLEKLLKISDPALYVLKGGVNLRFFFASPRYSEDMDLDVLGGSVGTLKKNGYKILSDAAFKRTLKTFGIEDIRINDPAKAKHTETTQRFRFRLVNASGDEFPTKVEFSRRQPPETEQVVQEPVLPEVARTYKRISYECRHYDASAAILQKVRALGGRVEVQARDVFDLYIFHLAGHLKKEELHRGSQVEERNQALAALSGITYEGYQGQVAEYLELEAQKRFGRPQDWEHIRGTVAEVLT